MAIVLVLVHGMGNHSPGWSSQAQVQLESCLRLAGRETTFIEVTYSDLVERTTVEPATAPEVLLSREDLLFEQLAAKMEGAFLDRYDVEIGEREEALIPAGQLQDWRTFAVNLLRYVARYMTSDDLRNSVRERVSSSIRKALGDAQPDGVVSLVGHSLGSVVAWDIVSDPQTAIGS